MLRVGEVARYKARLVARGFTQVEGIDYQETFSPIVRTQSIRILLAYATEHDLDLQQMDVCTAFLYGALDEELYMHRPEGYEDLAHPYKVLKLLKCIYGLKQSGRVWYITMHLYLLSIKFVQSNADTNVYKLTQGSSIVLLALYVDDVIFATNDQKLLSVVKEQLSSRFDMKDIGELKFCLGIQLLRVRDKGLIVIHQYKYINEILI